ncbi:MAG: SpoIID/LytB domain-containing protein, partial [Candidatus Eisenbacteria bacterium]|nr:SpoIID/LytB domain-containing protein [Candidatus Eisenbacteria bacterium]
PASATFDLRDEPTIAVGLAWDQQEVRLAALARDEPLEIAGGAAGKRHATALRVTLEDGRAVCEIQGVHPIPLDPGDTLRVQARGGPRDSTLRWKGSAWRGTFTIFMGPRGRLTVSDRLPLETYLRGVVPGEIGALDESQIEAGKAQAIAARSYTLFYRGRRTTEGFDLYGTVEDQVYGPVSSERPLASTCVESTHGTVALSNGYPIRANYCSTCGGITADVEEAWPVDPVPYLASHADRGAADWCAASPQYRWREEWSASEFLSDVARFAPDEGIALPAGGLGDLLDVRVDARSRSGRVWRLTVVTSRGEVAVPGYSVRRVLRRGGNSSAILRSNLFKIAVRRDGATLVAQAVVASGAGFGHGVGLCQTGALGMARAGESASAILHHYYPGAELERRY